MLPEEYLTRIYRWTEWDKTRDKQFDVLCLLALTVNVAFIIVFPLI